MNKMNMRIKKILVGIFAGTSFEWFCRKIYLKLSPKSKSVMYDLQTIEVMKKGLYKYSNCIDIGCHLGTILRWMLQIATHGKHFAFEPVPQLYKYLSHAFQNRDNVSIYNIALSDKIGEAIFYQVSKDPGYSGFRKRRLNKRLQDVEEIVVKIDRLDNLIPKNVPINFIKIDVEGAELQVLSGAIEIIRRFNPLIIFEHGLGAADYYGTTPNDIYKLLVKDSGLKISLLKEWLINGNDDSLQKSEFASQYWEGTNYLFLAHP
jgi:FkbM family methyltransferase